MIFSSAEHTMYWIKLSGALIFSTVTVLGFVYWIWKDRKTLSTCLVFQQTIMCSLSVLAHLCFFYGYDVMKPILYPQQDILKGSTESKILISISIGGFIGIFLVIALFSWVCGLMSKDKTDHELEDPDPML